MSAARILKAGTVARAGLTSYVLLGAKVVYQLYTRWI